MAGEKILIVDDDHDVRELLGLWLRAAGFETVFAADALSVANVARQESPALILLDLGLPGGSGMTVMERLRNFPALAHIPVVAISARDPQSAQAAALEAGAKVFLQKPVDQSRLVETIRAALA